MSPPPPRWFTGLSKAFREHPNANGTSTVTPKAQRRKIDDVLSAVAQLATTDKTAPQVRSCIVRELISPMGNEHLPIVLTTTDIRTPKVQQILANDTVQICWWIAPSGEQFRLTGKATLVPEPGRTPKSGGSGFDWEAKRVQIFDSLSDHMRAGWCRPTPGTPMPGGYEDAKKWPLAVPTTTGATTEEEKKLVKQALGNFALVLIEPTYVDWIQISVVPNRRTLFRRGGDGSWTETIVVP